MADNGITKEELLKILRENRNVNTFLENQGYIGHDQLNNQYFSEAIKELRGQIHRDERSFEEGAKELSKSSQSLDKLGEGLKRVIALLDKQTLNGNKVNISEWNESRRTEVEKGKLNGATREDRLAYGIIENYLNIVKKIEEKEEETNNLKEQQLDLGVKINYQRLLERKEAERLLKIETQGLTALEKRNEMLEKLGIKTQMVSNGWNEVKAGFRGILGIAEKLIEPYAKLDKATMNYARSMGLSSKHALELRNSMLQVTNSTKGLTELGFTTADLLEATAKYSAAIGRRVSLNGSQELGYAGMTKFLGDEGAQAIAKGVDNFGLDMTEASNRVRDMFVTSEKTGVAFETYSKTFVDNLKIAQGYTFSNGLRGLDAMAKKSAEIKLNIADVARIADKVSTLEGAMQAGAGLSVLGGSFAMYSNPMQMLYEGLNDMEALGERVEKMFAGSVFFDKEKGQLDMSAFDRQRMRAAAQAMGVDYNSMTEMAFARGRRDVVAKQLHAAGMAEGSAGYEKLLNQAYLDQNGKAMVNIKGTAYNVADVAQNDALLSIISRTSDNDTQNLATIAETLLSWDDVMTGVKKGMEEQMASTAVNTGIGDKVKDMAKIVAANADTVANIYMILQTLQMILMASSMMNGFGNMGRGIFNRGGGGGFGGGSTKGGGIIKQTVDKNGNIRYFQNGKRISAAAAKGALGKPSAGGGEGFGGSMIGGAVGTAGAMLGYVGSAWAANNKAKYADATDEEGLSKGANWGIAQQALSWGANGAMIGNAIFPGWGALAGGIIGATAGGLTAYNDENKAKYAKLIFYRSGHELHGDYSLGELEEMYNNPLTLSNPLRSKIAMAEGTSVDAHEIAAFLGYKKKKGKGYRSGGVVRGVGTGTSDSNLAWLSNNEYVMPAAQVAKPNNRAILDSMREGNNLIPRFANGGIFSPIKNSLKSMKVAQKAYSAGGSSSVGEVKVAPINITGTIKLDLNGTTKDIDANKLLNNTMFTKQLTDVIARNLNKQLNYGYDKNTFYKKF